MIIRAALEEDIEKIATLYVQNHRETYKGILPDAYFSTLTVDLAMKRGNDTARRLYEKLGAKHYCYFDDDFAGSVSHSEKLIWDNITEPFSTNE